MLSLADLTSDLSVYDLFGMLGAGGLVVFPAEAKAKAKAEAEAEKLEPRRWLDALAKHNVTIW